MGRAAVQGCGVGWKEAGLEANPAAAYAVADSAAAAVAARVHPVAATLETATAEDPVVAALVAAAGAALAAPLAVA